MTLTARIAGVGRYVPERVVTNHDLESIVDTQHEWIVERTGIYERRIAADHETASSMGAEAARRALASAGLQADQIDLIVTATCTADGLFPAAASHIQHAIGATRAGAFDVNAACMGFLAALSTGSQFIAGGTMERVLVVGSETMSRILDWTDRTTCVLFGDGAGAVILERSTDGEAGATDGFLLRSDGSLASLLYTPGPATPKVDGIKQEAKLVMDGRAVFRHAVTNMCDAAAEVLRQAGLTADDIALVVPHQANLRIITAMSERLGLPMERVYVNIQRYGNTSSATIPIALAEAEAEGRLKPGDHVLLAAFGGGLAWGAMVLQWAGVGTHRTVASVAGTRSGVA